MLKFAALIMALFLIGCSSTTATPTPDLGGEPLVATLTPTPNSLAITVVPTATEQPVQAATPQPSEPLRVRFAVGTYGTTINGKDAQFYLLWAKAGQRFAAKFNSGSMCEAQLRYHSKDVTQLTVEGDSLVAMLQDTGDHVLGVRCQGDFSVSVDIR
jgi:hypothetical protein